MERILPINHGTPLRPILRRPQVPSPNSARHVNFDPVAVSRHEQKSRLENEVNTLILPLRDKYTQLFLDKWQQFFYSKEDETNFELLFLNIFDETVSQRDLETIGDYDQTISLICNSIILPVFENLNDDLLAGIYSQITTEFYQSNPGLPWDLIEKYSSKIVTFIKKNYTRDCEEKFAEKFDFMAALFGQKVDRLLTCQRRPFS